jgi:hypothetical protein
VLTVTTNVQHAQNLLAYVTKTAGSAAGRFAFAVEPAFGANWRVPPATLNHLLDGPWITSVGPKHFGAA